MRMGLKRVQYLSEEKLNQCHWLRNLWDKLAGIEILVPNKKLGEPELLISLRVNG